MSANFSEILGNATVGEIEKPKPLPQGSYLAIIKKTEFDTTNSEKATPYCRVTLEIAGAMEDVSESDLEEFGQVQGKSVRTDFYLTDNALHMLQEFILEHVQVEAQGVSLEQAIPMLINNQVGVEIVHEPNQKDPSIIYANVKRTFNPDA